MVISIVIVVSLILEVVLKNLANFVKELLILVLLHVLKFVEEATGLNFEDIGVLVIDFRQFIALSQSIVDAFERNELNTMVRKLKRVIGCGKVAELYNFFGLRWSCAVQCISERPDALLSYHIDIVLQVLD